MINRRPSLPEENGEEREEGGTHTTYNNAE